MHASEGYVMHLSGEHRTQRAMLCWRDRALCGCFPHVQLLHQLTLSGPVYATPIQ
jgi:hypothetical protein